MSNIANIIYEQLGGHRFSLMTGSSNFVNVGNGLNMKLKPNQSKTKYLLIELNSNDTYKMQFYTVNKDFDKNIKFEYQNIYWDQMQEIFEKVTGLYTKL